MTIAPGQKSQSWIIRVLDDNGAGVTGLTAGTLPAMFYCIAGVSAAAVAITLVNLTNLNSAYASGGVSEMGGGNYRFDPPDAAIASVAPVAVWGEATGKRVDVIGVVDVRYVQADARQSMGGKNWYVAKKDSSGNAAVDTNDGRSWDKPFLTVFKATTVMAHTDVIRVGDGYFDEQNNRIDLSLGHTGTVHLIGSGVGVTIINSTVLSTSGPCIEVDSSIVRDLTVIALVAAPALQFPIGFTNSARDCKPWIENVEIIAMSDGFYTEGNTGAGRHFRSKNCRIRSNYDCCNFVDPTPWEMWEVDYRAEGAFSAFGRHRAIASAGNGTVHSGKLVAVHNSTNSQYAVAVESGNPLGSDSAEVMIMSGVHVSGTSPGGANGFDLIANHYAGGPSATIIVGEVVGSGAGGWVTNGGAGYSEEDNGSITYRTTSLRSAGVSYVGIVQAATPTVVTLGAGASSVDGAYNGQTFKPTYGPGVGLTAKVTAYNGTTKQLTVDPPLVVVPTALTNYVITTDVSSSSTGGTFNIGDTQVTSDTGPNQNVIVDNLRVRIPDGLGGFVGVSEATVLAYLNSEYVANKNTAPIRGFAKTKDDGRWDGMTLNRGLTYIIIASKDADAPMSQVILV